MRSTKLERNLNDRVNGGNGRKYFMRFNQNFGNLIGMIKRD